MSELIDEKRLEYLKQVHSECRSEVQMRITQRDNFAVQFIIVCGAVISIGLSDKKLALLLLALPFVALFYTIQILYSYSIHDRIHKFLVDNIEPEIGKLLQYKDNEAEYSNLFWETYCEVDSKRNHIKNPGIRKGFFIKVSYLMPIISSVMYYFTSSGLSLSVNNLFIAVTCSVVYTIIMFIVLMRFKHAKS